MRAVSGSGKKAAEDQAGLEYAITNGKLGYIAVTARPEGVCLVTLNDTAAQAKASVRARHPTAKAAGKHSLAARTAQALAAFLQGKDLLPEAPLALTGTPFQQRVWQALKEIPAGEVRTYGELAARLGLPGAARAVGNACAANPVALLVPCHRVVGAGGALGGYRWGVARKLALLRRERAPVSSPDNDQRSEQE